MNKLTVLMNCKNGERFLKESLLSIINQTYTDWKLFFFDNKSNDQSKNIFNSFNEPRFEYFYFEESLKLGEARNKAWDKINSEYVAICDVDDTFLKNRFEEQIKYMNYNIKCGVVGSNVFLIDSKSNKFDELKYTQDNETLKKKIQYQHVFNSATLFFRKKAVDQVGGYNATYEMVNDYDLLFRISKKFELSNIDKTLVCNRQHESNLSFKKIVKGQIELLKLQFSILKTVKKFDVKIKLYKKIFITLLRVIYHFFKKYIIIKK